MKSELLDAAEVQNQDSARVALRAIMVLRRMRVIEISRDISVSTTTLYTLLGGKNVSFAILMKIWRGIDKLQENRDI